MTTEAKVIIGTSIAALLILIGGIFFVSKSPQPTQLSADTVDQNLLMRKDSNKITSSSATVTLVEFGDFQCPACGAAHPIVKQIIGTYEGKLNFVFRNFPLDMHQNAKVAAEAAEAAGQQGKYWEMHNKLFDTQDDWGGETPVSTKDALELFVTYAKGMGLDTEKFRQSVEKNTFNDKIQQDQNDGLALGVNGTPTFFINGKQFKGGFGDLAKEIDAELSKAQ